MSQNWVCLKCKAYNHLRRKVCWRCGFSSLSNQGSTSRKDRLASARGKFRGKTLALGCIGAAGCILIFVFASLMYQSSLQQNRSPATMIVEDQPALYELQWNIEPGRPITYSAVMGNSVGNFTSGGSVSTTNQTSIFEGLLKQMLETASKIINFQTTSWLETTLDKTEQGNISVTMVTTKIEQSPVQLAQEQYLKAMQGKTFLQGEITPDGKLVSVYLEQPQRNLLALFFELPGKPVKVGDSWPIELVCITAVDSSQFTVETSSRENQITFTQITQTPDGELVAILDYKIVESLEGTQVIPHLSEEPAAASMKCNGTGRGEFLIEQGRWRQFSFEFMIETTGLMGGTSTQTFKLSDGAN